MIELIIGDEPLPWLGNCAAHEGPIGVACRREDGWLFGVTAIKISDGVYEVRARSDAKRRRFRKRDVLPLCYGYLFNDLGAEKLIGYTPASVRGALQLYKNIGMACERIDHSRGLPTFVMTQTREQCPWLT